MDLKKHFATDVEAEVEGVWHDLGEGGRLRIAHSSNPRWREAYRRVMGPYRQQIKRRTLSEDRIRALNIEVEAEAILVDWEGLEEDGKKVGKYTTEKAIRLLTDYPEFRRAVQELADDMTHYRNGAAEEDAADLGKS